MKSAILCAAGSGTRAGFSENKVLVPLYGLSALSRSLCAFQDFDEILIAARKEDFGSISPLLSPFPNARLIEGGSSRQESVYFALKEARGDIVLIHDAARPFVSKDLILRCLESVQSFGSGIPALPSLETAALCSGENFSPLPRGEVYTLQTPQGFLREKILLAHEKAREQNKRFTDESGMYSEFIGPPRLIMGERSNKKLTFREDFWPERVGFGVDTHAFRHQAEFDRGISRLNLNYITLGGVVIPSDRELEAHSDGDVVVHALMDALLSAANLRDIGTYFPDSDPKLKGIDSFKLLDKVKELLFAQNLRVKNVSISILCERPRLFPYIEAMREKLKKALFTENVAIAAGTNEKLGYIGEGKGITSIAFVLLESI